MRLQICKFVLSVLLFLNFNYQLIGGLNPPLFKFGIIADVQYCDTDTRGTRHYRASKDKLKEAFMRFNEEKVDFVLNLGDLIDHDYESYSCLLDIIKQSEAPVYHILGNHDFSVEESKKKKILKTLDLKRGYYTLKYSDWRFICLDGTDISLYANKEGTPEYIKASDYLESLKADNARNAYDWNGGIGQEQLKWYRSNLKKAEKKGENVIVACHFPIYPYPDAHNLFNEAEVRDVTNQFNGKMVFLHGHTHKSKFSVSDSVYYVSFSGMVEGVDNSFAIAEVFKNSISFKGFGNEKDNSINWK